MNATSSSLDRRAERFLKLSSWLTDRLDLNVPPIVEMDALRAFPAGSLGHAWAAHLDEEGFEPFGGPRRKQLHDGVHVVTGYETDPIGEAEVQAFLLGTKFSPVNLAIAVGLVRSLRRQTDSQAVARKELRSRIIAAYQRGKNSNFDPDGWRPEDLWDVPLETIRAKFAL